MHKVTKQLLFIALIGLVAFTIAACSNAGSGSNTADASVAATVNGKNIMLSEVDKLINQQLKGQQSTLSSLQLAQVRMQALDSLIQKEVLFQRAEREKLLPTAEEIEQFINTQMQQAQMTQDDFDKFLKEAGQTKESFREDTRKLLAVKKLQDRTNGKITVSDKEVDDEFNNNRAQYVNKRGVQLAAIIIDPVDNRMQSDAKSEAEAKQKVDEIYKQLENKAEFADVARAKSEDANSNASGGDIGFATEADLKQNDFPASLIDEFFNKMEIGGYSAPVTFHNKWYIFKLKARQMQDENLNLESPGVRQKITETLVKQRIEVLNQALMSVALNDAKILNNLALKMLESPNNLSGPRPAQQQGTTPSPSPSASAAATATPSSSPAASPAASAQPKKK